MKPVPPERLKFVDLMRTVSILAVMALHFHFEEPAAGAQWWQYALSAFAKGGAYGVSLFFVISGFVISRVIDMRYEGLFNIDVKDFYARRIGRIWPLLITVVSVALILVWQLNLLNAAIPQVFDQILSPNPKNFDFPFYASLCTFTNNILVAARQNQYGLQWGILWSIAVEEQFYLFYPQALRLLQSTKKLIVLLGILIAIAPFVRWAYVIFGAASAPFVSLGSYDLLAVGILLLLSHKKYGATLKQKPLICWLLLAAGFVLAAAVYVLRQDKDPLQYALAPTFFGLGAYMMFMGGLNLKAMDYLPSVLTYPGQLSYGMYLYHPLVMLGVGALVDLPRAPLFVVFALANIGFSACSFNMYERPLDRLVYKRVSGLFGREVGAKT